MTFDPEAIFTELISLRKELNAELPDDDLDVILDYEDDIMPGRFLIYDPDQTKATRKYHFTKCQELQKMHDEGCLMSYRITNNVSELFRMYDGSLERLPVCKSCLEKIGYINADDFNIREFFRNHKYERIPEYILADIWMGTIEGIYCSDSHYYNNRNWRDIISPIHRKISGHCEICGNEKNLDVHHVNMYRPDTRSDNLIVLCRSCHVTIHRAIEHIIAGKRHTDKGKRTLSKYNLIINERKENNAARKK